VFDELVVSGQPLDESRLYTFTVAEHHRFNFESSFGFPVEEALANAPDAVAATSDQEVLIERIPNADFSRVGLDNRIVITG